MKDSIAFARLLKAEGIHSRGLLFRWQRPAAEDLHRSRLSSRLCPSHSQRAGVSTGAVGMITAPEQADQIIRTGQAVIVLLAREMLRDPYWPLHAAEVLHHAGDWPVQYERAARGKVGRRQPYQELRNRSEKSRRKFVRDRNT